MTTVETQVRDFLTTHLVLAEGLGTVEEPCSVAAINLALTGRLSDDIPPCMSEVIGEWMIVVQDAMPAEIRNGDRWRDLLPRAAGTGRELERERADLILDWMWVTVLPSVQAVADAGGFGVAWSTMCRERTADAAYWAWAEASEAAAPGAAAAAVWAEAASAEASAHAAREAAMTTPAAWTTFDPCGLLDRLIDVDNQTSPTKKGV